MFAFLAQSHKDAKINSANREPSLQSEYWFQFWNLAIENNDLLRNYKQCTVSEAVDIMTVTISSLLLSSLYYLLLKVASTWQFVSPLWMCRLIVWTVSVLVAELDSLCYKKKKTKEWLMPWLAGNKKILKEQGRTAEIKWERVL